jgi:iron-regulated transporter 1
MTSPRELEVEVEPESAVLEDISEETAGDEDEPTSSDEAGSKQMTKSQAINLYTSHLLSTWNVRTYEFAAVSVESQRDSL